MVRKNSAMTSLLRIATVILTLNFLRLCQPVAGYFESDGSRTTPASPTKFCGTALADALSTVCQGVFNGKRSGIRHNNIVPDTDFYDDQGYPDGEFPMSANLFRSKRNVLSLLKSIRLKRDEKVVDECCRKACTYDEMRGYCG